MSNLGFLHKYVPPSRADAPTLLLLHGTGGNEDDLLPLGRTLLPGAALLSPRGKVLENGMPRFFRRFAEGVFDLEDLKLRTGELARFIAAAREDYKINSPIFAVGYSNGANIAASLLLSYPGVLRGGVLLRAMVPFIPDSPPDLTGVSLLLGSGLRDPIAPTSQAEQLGEIFRQAGATISFHWHKGGHELGQDDIDAARDWLAASV